MSRQIVYIIVYFYTLVAVHISNNNTQTTPYYIKQSSVYTDGLQTDQSL